MKNHVFLNCHAYWCPLTTSKQKSKTNTKKPPKKMNTKTIKTRPNNTPKGN